MANLVTPQQRVSIQERTIVYHPIYVNGMEPNDAKGSYVLFYIFTDTPEKIKPQLSSKSCIVKTLHDFGFKVKHSKHTFIKIGNFSSGSKSRHASNKGDLIKNDGNRSPAARHSQDVLINHPELYCHFIMVVLSDDTVEANLEDALKETYRFTPNNKVETEKVPPGKWNSPVPLSNVEFGISSDLALKIRKNKK